jgi:hypothetical protein
MGKRIVLALLICLCFTLTIPGGCKKKDQSEEARQAVPEEEIKQVSESKQVVQSNVSEKSKYVYEPEQTIQSLVLDRPTHVSETEQVVQSSASEATEHFSQTEIIEPNSASSKINLRILYAGQSDTDRAKDFVDFLSKHFKKVETTDYKSFTGKESDDFDVTVIDYDGVEFRAPQPNIPRQYTRATVTIGVPGAFLCSRLSLKTGYL